MSQSLVTDVHFRDRESDLTFSIPVKHMPHVSENACIEKAWEKLRHAGMAKPSLQMFKIDFRGVID